MAEEREGGVGGCEWGCDESPATADALPPVLGGAALDERGSSNGRPLLGVEVPEAGILGLSKVCRRGIRRGPGLEEEPGTAPLPLPLPLPAPGPAVKLVGSV